MNIPKISFPTINLSQKISSANQAVGNFLGRSVTHVKNGACKTAQTVKNAFFAIGRGFQAAARAVASTTRKVTTSICSGVKSVASKVANTFARIFKKEKKSSNAEEKAANVVAQEKQAPVVAQEKQAPVVVVEDDVAPVAPSNDQPAQVAVAAPAKKTKAPRQAPAQQLNGEPVRRSRRLAKV
jgi:hypothetical protein